MDQILFYCMPVIFILGIIFIALEDVFKINKSAIALCMCILLWGLLFTRVSTTYEESKTFLKYLFHHPEYQEISVNKQLTHFIADSLVHSLGSVSETLFFVLCSMVIVHLIDKFGGFRTLINLFETNDKRKLFVTTAFLSFILSAFLDNLATAILMLALLNKLVPNHVDRMKFACMSIIACNAGGSWSPVGDVTTLILWTKGRMTLMGQVTSVFFPALINLIVPLTIAYFTLFTKGTKLRLSSQSIKRNKTEIPERISTIVLILGFAGIALVPLWQLFFDIPPVLGILIGLTVLWFFTDIYLYRCKSKGIDPHKIENISVVSVLRDADMATFFYFTGILMSVEALITGGQLGQLQHFLDKATAITSNGEYNNLILASVMGFISSFSDNVALVAAILGVYPEGYNSLSYMMVDGSFWIFLAYSCVTGGSLLIIGSATGVAVMGMQKISFVYYLKRFSLLALAGYFAGAFTYILLNTPVW